MMPFPYFSSDKGGWGGQTSAIIVRDPQDVLRKKSVQSCTFTLKTREVFTGRIALLGLLDAGSSRVSLDRAAASAIQEAVIP